MNLSSRPPRTPSRLSDSLHRQLNMYALAATAAGVSALALAHSAEAKIIYTKAHVVLNPRSVSHYYIDLNHDGTNDFAFAHGYSFSVTTGFWGSWVAMFPYKQDGNGILAQASGFASALRAGAKIGPGNRFSHYGFMADAGGTGKSYGTHFAGPWANGGKGLSNRYVGLQFSIKGKTHYGWARVNVSKFRFSATLTGYAYETVPKKSIVAGKTKGSKVITVAPGSLGRLTLGRK